MSKIRIKNFGPIKKGFVSDENPDCEGFMDIRKVTVLTGNQGSGKSTLAKLVSTIMWIEKALNRGELRNRLINFDAFKHLCKYQKIENYISEETEIEYHGDLYSVLINSPKPPVIQEIEGEIYIVPKIMYVSAERNFLSAIESAFNVTGLPDHLADFAEEFKRAQIELKGAKVELPI